MLRDKYQTFNALQKSTLQLPILTSWLKSKLVLVISTASVKTCSTLKDSQVSSHSNFHLMMVFTVVLGTINMLLCLLPLQL